MIAMRLSSVRPGWQSESRHSPSFTRMTAPAVIAVLFRCFRIFRVCLVCLNEQVALRQVILELHVLCQFIYAKPIDD